MLICIWNYQSGSTLLLTENLAKEKLVYPLLWNAFSSPGHGYPFFTAIFKSHCTEKAAPMLATSCSHSHQNYFLFYVLSHSLLSPLHTAVHRELCLSVSTNRPWDLLGPCLTRLCFPLNLDSVSCLTGILMFKTSLFLSPQVLAIVIGSHIFHVHLVTLLLKDKTTHYFSPGSRSATTTMTYLKRPQTMADDKYLPVSLACGGALSPPCCPTSFKA